MSNEYKDWIEDRTAENRALIEKYPFLQIKENGVYPWLEQNGYEETWLDCLPDGWRIAFGEQLCNDLLMALGSYANEWIIVQVKEKWAALRIYHSGAPDGIYEQVEAVIAKYEDLSEHTCIRCGKPATKYTKGWILPMCDECYEEHCKMYKIKRSV